MKYYRVPEGLNYCPVVSIDEFETAPLDGEEISKEEFDFELQKFLDTPRSQRPLANEEVFRGETLISSETEEGFSDEDEIKS